MRLKRSRLILTYVTPSGGPAVRRAPVWLELILAWVLLLYGLEDLFHLAIVSRRDRQRQMTNDR